MKKNPTVSLCMIVKNEEETLQRTLESVKKYVDEMIVVDTGSTDKTKEIATSMGAKLYDYKWENDFASARNFAKEQATGDWILQLDADEYFMNDEASFIKEEIEKTDKLALFIQITNLVAQNQIGNSHSYARLFKNIPELSYQYRIHEQVLKNGQPISAGSSSLRIIHTGYTDETIKKKNKRVRNMKILEAELKKNPKDSFMLFNMANEYTSLGKNEKALEYLKKAHKYSNGMGVAFAIVNNIVKVLSALKRDADALKVCQEAQQVYPDYTDLFFLEGEILERNGRLQEAKKAYETCLKLGEANKRYLTIKGIGTIYPRERLIRLFIKERNYPKAIQFLNEMLEINKYQMSTLRKLVNLLKTSFDEEQIVTYLDELYQNEGEKGLLFKLQVAQVFRMKKGISLYYSNIKGTNLDVNEFQEDFFIQFLSENTAKAREILEKNLKSGEKNKLKLAIIYYLFTKDSVIKEYLVTNKTSKMLVEVIDKTFDEEKAKKGNYDVDLYASVLSELVMMKKYEEFELLLKIQEVFPPVIYKKIGELLEANIHDELAMEYYVRYLKNDQKNYGVAVTVSEILFNLNMYDEAILFAQQAFTLNERLFRPIEIIIESCKQKNDTKAVNETVKEALKLFPDSTYLLEQMEYHF